MKSVPLPRLPPALQVLGLSLFAAVPTLLSWWEVRRYWRPTGDSAVIMLRAADVGTLDSPVLGMPSTAGADVFHPGPLGFYFLAAFDRVLGAAEGAVAGAMVVTVLSLTAVIAITARRASLMVAAGVALLAFLSTVSLSGEPLVFPFNPYMLLGPLAAFLCASVFVGRGDRLVDAVWVVAGSFSAQLHLTAAVIVVVVGGSVLAHQWLVDRGESERFRLVGRTELALLGVLWLPPLLHAVGHGGGNFRRILAAAIDPSSSEVVGIGRAIRISGAMFDVMPVYAADDPSAWSLFTATNRLGTLLLAVAAVILLAAVLRVGHSRVSSRLPTVGLAAIASGVILVARIPDEPFNTLALHNYLWMWIVGPFALVAVVFSVRQLLAGVGDRPLDSSWHVSSGVGWRRLSLPLLAVASAAVLALWAVAKVPSIEGDRTSPVYSDELAMQLLAHEDDQSIVFGFPAELEEYEVTAGVGLLLEGAGQPVAYTEQFSDGVGAHRIGDPGIDGVAVEVYFDHAATGPPCGSDVLAAVIPGAELLDRRQTAVDQLVTMISNDRSLAPFAGDDLEAYVSRGLVAGVRVGLADPSLQETEPFQELEALESEPTTSVYIVTSGQSAGAECDP